MANNSLKGMSVNIACKAEEVTDAFTALVGSKVEDVEMNDVDEAFNRLQELGIMAQQFGRRIAFITGQAPKIGK